MQCGSAEGEIEMVNLAIESAAEGVMKTNDPGRSGLHFDTGSQAFRALVDNLRRWHHMGHRIRCSAGLNRANLPAIA
jgi:hypothetical protein